MGSFFFQSVFVMMFILIWVAESDSKIKNFNVRDYGAIPDGKTDNSEAFLKAWSKACKWNGLGRVWIPKGTFMLKPLIFEGPCKGWISFVIKGVLMASTDPSSLSTEQWINFRHVDNLVVSGGGKLDGRGSVFWAKNDCHKNHNCRQLPTSMRFDFVKNSRIHHIKSINSKNVHFVVFGCENINMTKIKISAPDNSPNTDGIKIAQSYGINITDVIIGTGDDCIAMISGTRNVRISRVTCGPGHGISVGSLGKYEGEEDVNDIIVRNCTFHGTSNGVRIKTWAKSLRKPLKASNFVFEDIFMDNVANPIIIDQQYCPHPPCKQMASQVQISNVKFKNIRGSCSSDVSTTFRCSKSKPCYDITMEDIAIWPQQRLGGSKLKSLCYHVNGDSYGTQIPPSCL